MYSFSSPNSTKNVIIICAYFIRLSIGLSTINNLLTYLLFHQPYEIPITFVNINSTTSKFKKPVKFVLEKIEAVHSNWKSKLLKLIALQH